MKPAAVVLPPQDVRAELSELREKLERLSAELDDLRQHAAALEELALEDPLTGLLNRRGFLRDLGRAIAYRARYGTPIAVLLADLDRFKPINDTYGHEAGDKALSHFASLLRRNTRASDGVARLGGDEFALILWNIDEATARNKAAALEGIVEGKPLDLGGVVLSLAASIGIAALEPKDSPEDALLRADQAMYRRKAERKAARG